MKLKDMVKTENIISVSPQDTLSQALSRLSSSHDGAFIFDDKRKLLGVVNPYYAIIKNSYPANAKAIHCAVMPPKLRHNQSAYEAARLMMESKLHYLPVFDDKQEFMGIVSARHIMMRMSPTGVFAGSVAQILRHKRMPITIDEDDSLAHAIHLFKQYKVSKLIVVSKAGKLRGMLSYYDLMSYLAVPKERMKSDRRGRKDPFLGHRVGNYMKSTVITLDQDSPMSEAVNMILERKVGSIVVINTDHYPIGIVTTKDILTMLGKGYSSNKFVVVGKNLSGMSRRLVNTFSRRFAASLHKKNDVEKATLIVKEEHGGGLFTVLFSMLPKGGTRAVIKSESRDLSDALSQMKKKLQH